MITQPLNSREVKELSIRLPIVRHQEKREHGFAYTCMNKPLLHESAMCAHTCMSSSMDFLKSSLWHKNVVRMMGLFGKTRRDTFKCFQPVFASILSLHVYEI